MIISLVVVSLRNFLRIVFCPLYLLDSATHEVKRTPYASLIGIAFTIPMFGFSIFAVLCAAKLVLIKQQHLLDNVAKVSLFQKNITGLENAFAWIKLPGLSTDVNNMLCNVTIDMLTISVCLYGIYRVYCLIQKNSVTMNHPLEQTQIDHRLMNTIF
jgi:hypothetical protein